jgi:hypothetical protein
MVEFLILLTLFAFPGGIALLVYLWHALSEDRHGSDLFLLLLAYVLTFPLSLVLLLGFLGDALLKGTRS